MDEWIEISRDDKHVAREKQKAKELRQSQWWKNEIAKGRCHYCGKTFPPDALTMDHVLPIVRGGKSARGNIVPCCKQCNNDKKYLTPAEIILRKLENGE
ncbi:MAG: HNH endonuclease [Lentisphaerota bacterium]